MKIPELTKFVTNQLAKIRNKEIIYDTKDMPKIDMYLKGIKERGDIIITETPRLQRYMDEIILYISELEKRGVRLPSEVEQYPQINPPINKK